ncbi:hypothetical protein V6N12_052215 [Hibiscus sabdariffa]|uniref:Chalcone isomerase domain-containing protein n=1 Tax=Hibiscus sabdariffa TaxID=183260 RepID=A0ABR2GHK4_9ROSI
MVSSYTLSFHIIEHYTSVNTNSTFPFSWPTIENQTPFFSTGQPPWHPLFSSLYGIYLRRCFTTSGLTSISIHIDDETTVQSTYGPRTQTTKHPTTNKDLPEKVVITSSGVEMRKPETATRTADAAGSLGELSVTLGAIAEVQSIPNNWLLFMDFDGGSPDIFPMGTFVSSGLGAHLFSQYSSFVDNSLYHSKQLFVPGSLAFREAFSCVSKFTGVVLCWFSTMSTSKLSGDISSGNQRCLKSRSCKSSALVKHIASCENNIAGFCFASDSRSLSVSPLVIGKISSYAMRNFFGEAEALQHIPLLSLAAVLIPPLDNLSSKVLAVPLDNTEVQMPECMDRRPCEVGQGCGSMSFLDLNWRRHAVEPRTGIEFPTILDNILDTPNNSSLASEVLVGTGSRTMKTVSYIMNLFLYERVGRILTNPNTDYSCLTTFGSYFTQDIPLPAGTIIDFQRTADGQLITKIGGNQVGAVHSKDLCRAFFDMYIGDLPVSEQTKEDIGRNVASIIRRC